VKYASLALVALALIPATAVGACASGGANQAVGGADGSGGAGDGVTTGGSEVTTGSGGGGGAGGAQSAGTMSTGSGDTDGGTCVSKCTTDDECQKSCPSGGTNPTCCDMMTGHCFVSTTAICPMPKGDGGMMPPY
jgi:hypothetical protein